MQKITIPLVILLLATACATSQPGPTEDVIEYGELSFDGSECIVSGPARIPTGNYRIVFYDTSEQPGIQLYLVGLDEGKTIQDLIDRQIEPGEWVPKPDWAFYGTRQWFPADKEWVHIISEVGDYVIYVSSESPAFLWFCSQIKVY
ncbi:MAG: hypothetical protein KAR65_04710 [Anaerolineales bacterium]|nr:hypothetical protein [Anaerolineales bacterium]